MPDMIEVKVAEAEGATLDWMVAKAVDQRLLHEFGGITVNGERRAVLWRSEYEAWFPSRNWTQAGPLIDRFEIELFISATAKGRRGAGIKGRCALASDSYLLSAMRVLVRAELGDTVAVPAELQRKEDNPT